MSTSSTPERKDTAASDATPAAQVSLKVEFGGGLELLFGNERKHSVSLILSEGKKLDLRYLINWLKENKLKERPELFVDGDTVRPGILVLINDTDWELEGEEDYVMKEGDDIVFISTLHGG